MSSIRFLVIALVFSLTAIPAQATLISVSGPNSLRGAAAAIIAAPSDVNDGAANNLAQQGFDEIQNFVLFADIAVDGGTIPTGTTISSHMIFLNNSAADGKTLNEHIGVMWTFNGNVLGVMSDYTGSEEVATSSVLGAAGTAYPVATFNARGMEIDDSYSFLGSILTVNMRIRQPGDWIRVITASDTRVPEPATALLLVGGLLGLLGLARYRARKAT